MGIKKATDAILSGCNDVLVAQYPDGTLKCTSFCVRFGRIKIRNRGQKFVRLECNGKVTNVFMQVGSGGECSFVEEEKVPDEFKERHQLTSQGEGELAEPKTPSSPPASPVSTLSTSSTFSSPRQQKVLGHGYNGGANNSIPTSDQLAKLNLKPGRNDIRFLVDSRMRGVQTLACRAYLVSSTTKIVVSDIDGTITKSNVGGQIAGFLKRDFSHNGIAKFYSELQGGHGHQIVYLTSRPITSNISTREYIDSVLQWEGRDKDKDEDKDEDNDKDEDKGGDKEKPRGKGRDKEKDKEKSRGKDKEQDAPQSPQPPPAADPTSPAEDKEKKEREEKDKEKETRKGVFNVSSAISFFKRGANKESPKTKSLDPGAAGEKDDVGSSGGSSEGGMPASPAYRLPPGPVIACPDYVFQVIFRELRKQPHLFKIPALLEILEVFNYTPEPPRLNYGVEAEALQSDLTHMGIKPAVRDEHGFFVHTASRGPNEGEEKTHPFVAAFGNAPTDLISYYCVGIPLERIFIVNPRSQIRSGNRLPPLKVIDADEYKLSAVSVDIAGWTEAMVTGSCLDIINSKQVGGAELRRRRHLLARKHKGGHANHSKVRSKKQASNKDDIGGEEEKSHQRETKES